MQSSTSQSDFHLFVRRTTDWSDENVFGAQLEPAFAPKVETWDGAFRMPYRVFRNELAKIASENHAALGCHRTDVWDDIPIGAIVLPSDDDDWFAPHLLSRIASVIGPGDLGCLWTQSVLEVPINFLHGVNLIARRIVPSIAPKWLCATNNYAFRKTDAAKALIGHMGASKAFGSPDFQVVEISERLSLHNRTLASITSMAFNKKRMSASELQRKACKYRRLYASPQLPRGLEWAASGIRRMAELMDAL
jgi:hypothetical protein